MIAASSTGTSFGVLGAYLVGDDDRVGWAELWNTMELDPRGAAGAMRRHVELSESRVKHKQPSLTLARSTVEVVRASGLTNRRRRPEA